MLKTAKLLHCLYRSKPDQDAKPNPSCVTTVSEEDTSLESTDNEIVDEIMLKGQDKDREEKDEMKEELWRTPTGDRSPPGKDAESQEVSGKEEQLEGELSTGVAADEIAASEKEVFAEDGLGNRLVGNHIFLFCFSSSYHTSSSVGGVAKKRTMWYRHKVTARNA